MFRTVGRSVPRTASSMFTCSETGEESQVRRCVSQVACRFRIDAYRYRIALAGIRVVEEIGAKMAAMYCDL